MDGFTGNAFSNGSDVTMAEAQEAIKDTLVSDESRNKGSIEEIFQRLDSEPLLADEAAEPEGEQEPQEAAAEEYDPQALAREDIDKAAEDTFYDLRDEQAQQLADEQLQQAEPAQVLESYQEAIERMDLRTEESAELAVGVAHDMGVPNPDPGKMENLLMVTAMSAARHGFAQISPEVGQAWTAQLYPSFGGDVRFASELSPWQSTVMAQSSHDAFANIETTVQALEDQGIEATVENVNQDKNGSILYFRNFLCGVIGQEIGRVDVDQAGKVTYATTGDPQLDQLALRVGDRYTALYLSMRQRAAQSEQRAAHPSNKRNNALPEMTSNLDIFDDEAMAEYHKHHGRI